MLCVRTNPKNSDAWKEITRVQQRLNEEQKGLYQFSDMYKQAESTPPLIDCATYVGSVAVRDSPGRGKGLFTTKPVKAGELLLCEKAFVYSYADDESDLKIPPAPRLIGGFGPQAQRKLESFPRLMPQMSARSLNSPMEFVSIGELRNVCEKAEAELRTSWRKRQRRWRRSWHLIVYALVLTRFHLFDDDGRFS